MTTRGPYKRQARNAARQLFIYDRKSADMIARQLKVQRSTFMRWKAASKADGDDWDKARVANALAGEGAMAVAVQFLEDFLFLLQNTMEEVKRGEGQMTPMQRVDSLTRLADAYTKATLAVQRSMPKVNELTIATDVLQLLSRFIAEKHGRHAKAFAEVLEPFGEVLAKRFG